MLKQSFIFLTLILLAFEGFGQIYKLTGTISEEGSNEPLVNATIRVRNSVLGAVTDPNGNFTLEMTAGSYDLMISSVGFATIEETIEINADLEY